MKSEQNYPRTEPNELVELALHELEEDLYGAGQNARRTVYAALLDNLCHMLLIDGGPTFGLEVCDEGRAKLREWEAQRGRKEAGPFLSKAHRDKLMDSPGRYLRQDIEMTGPNRWKVVDEWHG